MSCTATGTHHSQTILKKRSRSFHPIYAVFQQETELLLKSPAAGFVSGFQDPSDIPQRQQPKPAPCHPPCPHSPSGLHEFRASCTEAVRVKPSTGLSCTAAETLWSTGVWFSDGCPPSGNKFSTTALLSSLQIPQGTCANFFTWLQLNRWILPHIPVQ